MGKSTNPVETAAIVDLGNDIQITYSVSGIVYTLNKLSLKVKQTDKAVFITNADGFTNSPDNQVLPLNYTMISSPVYASNDEFFAGITGMISGVSLGSGGGGGSDNIYSNAAGQFVATPTVGTSNITITGLPHTLEAIQVAAGSLQKINSSGEVSTLNTSNVVVSGSVITLSGEDVFETGDVILASLAGPDKAYDDALDSDITTILNPDSAKWTSPEHLVDLSAQAADTLRYVIPMEGFKDLSMHWLFTNSNAGDTITMTLWATNNAAADDSADTNWVDVSGDLLTKTLTVTNGTVQFIEVLKEAFYLKLMVKLVVVSAAATNAVDIYIKKKAL